MASAEKIISIVVGTVSAFTTEPVQKFLFGTYSDGTPRSFSDAYNGEVLSPKQKQKKLYKKKKQKNRKIRL